MSGCQENVKGDNYINDEKGEHKNANKIIRKDENKEITILKMIPKTYQSDKRKKQKHPRELIRNQTGAGMMARSRKSTYNESIISMIHFFLNLGSCVRLGTS